MQTRGNGPDHVFHTFRRLCKSKMTRRKRIKSNKATVGASKTDKSRKIVVVEGIGEKKK